MALYIIILNKIKRRLRYARRNNRWRSYQKIYTSFGYNINWNDKFNRDEANNVYFFTESPEVVQGLLRTDFSDRKFRDADIFAAFERPEGLHVRSWTNVTTMYSLCDKFTSYSEMLKHEMREDRAILLRSTKSILSGHNLRRKLQPNSSLDIVELDGSLSDLRSIYTKYKVVVVIENTDSPGYVSEKFFDAIKCGCSVVYSGDIDYVLRLGFSGVYHLEKSEDIERLVEYALRCHDNSIAERNHNRLTEIRESQRLAFLMAPSLFLIKGEK